MQILKQGKVPDEFKGTCWNCGCVVSCTKEEYEEARLWFGWAGSWVDCPTPKCGCKIRVLPPYDPPTAGELGL